MGIPARRTILENLRPDQQRFPHAGLWLDKFLPEQFAQGETGGEDAYREHFKWATEIPVAGTYQQFFNRWEAMLIAAETKRAVATTRGRLVIGLGADSVLENAITLHRTYGVPVIPGSALKGLAAAYARNRLDDPQWKKDGKAYKILFGDTNSAGYVTFFDALYHPDGSPKKPLVMDVVTVHHQGYYQDKNEPPADWDSPTPVPFVSVRNDVKFLVALAGPDEWVEAAFQIVGRALEEEGIGAKTNSGYGRMALKLVEEVRELSPDQTFREKVEATSDINKDFVTLYVEWENLEVPEDAKRDLARLILAKVDAAGLPKSWAKKAKKESTREKALRNQERYQTLVAATGKKD